MLDDLVRYKIVKPGNVKEIEHGLFYVLSTCFEAKMAKTFVLYPWVDISKRFHKTVCIIDIISFLLNWPKQPVLAQIYYSYVIISFDEWLGKRYHTIHKDFVDICCKCRKYQDTHLFRFYIWKDSTLVLFNALKGQRNPLYLSGA